MSIQVSRCLAASLFLLLATSAHAQNRHPLDGLGPREYLETSYLNQPVAFSADVKAHSIVLHRGTGNDGVQVILNTAMAEFNLFGDFVSRQNREVRVWAKLSEVKMPDPTKKDRRVFAIVAKELDERLFLVTPGTSGNAFRLLARDKDGTLDAVMNLEKRREELLLPPCHPGCFPAGTLVRTPDGLKKIETIRPGDMVVNVAADGKTAPAKVASIFTGDSELVEVETEAGKLISTPKQPLSLANGEVRSAGRLVKDDAVQCWKDGKPQAVKVRGVKKLEKPAWVFNLVLEKSGTFIANDYLVRSKPPADK